jgi:thioester reductase-like protein/aryl carrier-like protein
MIWLFPEGRAPVTAVTVRRSIEYADGEGYGQVRYFTAVPYIMQMLAEDVSTVERLQKMDLVGVGGAALPSSVGDFLVDRDVKLVSRFGSAESGFVMSSYRDFSKDRNWQYLRADTSSEYLSFKTREEDGLSELILRPSWPHIAKANRKDGSYATSDLFEAHPEIPNAWRYHSRADAQITLVTGKKFDPAPMESHILARSKLLRDVLVFGTGRGYAGALLFPKPGVTKSPQNIVDSTWPIIEDMNHDSQIHARISKSMLTVVQATQGPPLAKSSKGTILRTQAEGRYAREIERTYNAYPGSFSIAKGEVLDAVATCLEMVLARPIDPDADLFSQGVDSIASMQIRAALQHAFLENGDSLPLNIVYDCGSISSIAQYIVDVRNGTAPSADPTDDELGEMRRLVEEFSRFTQPSPVNHTREKSYDKVVLLTGATGALGAHIAHLLLGDPRVRTIYCLVRGTHTVPAAYERVAKAVRAKGLSGMEPFHGSQWRDAKVVCLPHRLSEPNLGLSDSDWKSIAENVSHIVHAAWAVNFAPRLRSFREHIAGTHNLLDLATRTGARCYFISSAAAVAESPSRPIPELPSDNPSDASPLGYSRSKWVAEQICAAAHKALCATQSFSSDRGCLSHGNGERSNTPGISVVRVGQLCGNEHGIWNTTEAYPLMLSSVKMTGCLPDLEEWVTWLPVDVAAKAILEILHCRAADVANQHDGMPVYHVLNNHRTPKWSEMLRWIQSSVATPRWEIVPPATWLQRLERALDSNDASPGTENIRQPTQALLPLWKTRYGPKQPTIALAGDGSANVKSVAAEFSISRSADISPSIRSLQPINRLYALRLWEWSMEHVGQ